MHSSRMGTVRCSERLLGGGVSAQGEGCLPGIRGVVCLGASAWGGVCQGVCVCLGGVYPRRGVCQTPPCEQNHRQV